MNSLINETVDEKAILKLPDHDDRLEAEIADTFFSRTQGLRLRKEGKMLFKFEESGRCVVDSMLMLKPVHLYFLDENCEVVETGELQPWRMYTPENGFKYLLESFEDLGLESGDDVVLMLLKQELMRSCGSC